MAERVRVSPRKRGRSPSYPGIDLGEALELAEKLERAEGGGRYPVPVNVILRHWGYKSAGSGPALVTLSALKKFGLLIDEGSKETRQARLSDLALDIIKDTRKDSLERAGKIKKAALLPPIHREIWQKYSGSLPSDETLKFHLERNKGFTETGALDFIKQFRRTVKFAKLEDSANISEGEEDKERGSHRMSSAYSPPPPSLDGNVRDIQLPLSADSWATLRAQFPMSEAAWQRLMTLLDAMKPALVAREAGEWDEEEAEETNGGESG